MDKSILPCPVCGGSRQQAFRSQVLNKYDVAYWHCAGCGLLQTESPYWLDEAYSDAIAVVDTGLVMRNLSLAARLAVLLYLDFEPKGAYLDVAGGYGMLVRLMRDYGFDYYWDDKYCQNLLARGFAADKAEQPFIALTAFEVLEHVHDPLAFIQEKLDQHTCRTLIFTTELYEGDAPPAMDWWYYLFNTGQHVSFYQRKTLERLAGRLGLNFYSVNGLYIFTDRSLRMPFLQRVLMGRLAPPMAMLIRHRLGSRTLADHFLLKEKTEGCPKG